MLNSDSIVRQAPADVESGDWEQLLCTVKARLKLVVDADRAPASVLECVGALDRLHAALTHEFGRRRQLEREVVDTHAALAQALNELVGTQAGERRARHLASHDGLTSLPNRGYFRERLAHALARAAPRRPALAVLYLDLDGFKPINDVHGHAVGDELLRIVAARLTRAVRAGDVVGRLGGDEFACLLADVNDREQLSHLACKLLDAVSAPLKIGQVTLTVRPSIGIAICPTDGATAETLLEHADAAMYGAKRQQTGYAFFDRRAEARRAAFRSRPATPVRSPGSPAS